MLTSSPHPRKPPRTHSQGNPGHGPINYRPSRTVGDRIAPAPPAADSQPYRPRTDYRSQYCRLRRTDYDHQNRGSGRHCSALADPAGLRRQGLRAAGIWPLRHQSRRNHPRLTQSRSRPAAVRHELDRALLAAHDLHVHRTTGRNCRRRWPVALAHSATHRRLCTRHTLPVRKGNQVVGTVGRQPQSTAARCRPHSRQAGTRDAANPAGSGSPR